MLLGWFLLLSGRAGLLKNPVSWLLGHCKCVCAVAGGVLKTFSGHNSPWKRFWSLCSCCGQLHPDPGTWAWLQPLPVGTGVAIPRLFLCVWALIPEICSLVLFKLVSSLGEKGLGLRQRLQLPPVRGREPADSRMGKGGWADTLHQIPGHGDGSRLCQICGNCSSQGGISPSQRREGAEGEEAEPELQLPGY